MINEDTVKSRFDRTNISKDMGSWFQMLCIIELFVFMLNKTNLNLLKLISSSENENSDC